MYKSITVLHIISLHIYGKKKKRRKQSGEREMEKESQNGAYVGRGVMTEEQMETLRKQIAVYAVICEQLALLHNSLSSFHPLSSGTLLSLYI